MRPIKAHRRQRALPFVPSVYRLLFPNGNAGSPSRIELRELELFETIGGPDPTTGGVATSSTVLSTNTPDRLIDNSGTSVFQCWGQNGDWWRVNLVTPAWVNRMVIAGSGTQPYWNPEVTLLQYLAQDNATWVTRITTPAYGTNDWPINTTKTFDYAG